MKMVELLPLKAYVYPLTFYNTEFNDLRKNICLRKSEVLLKEFQCVMSLKNWRSMAYTVCHAPIPLIS